MVHATAPNTPCLMPHVPLFLLPVRPVTADIGRTHSGLITAFSNHLVKNGSVPKEMGRLLNRAQGIRQVADYKGNSVEMSDAQEMVEQAELFVAARRSTFMFKSK